MGGKLVHNLGSLSASLLESHRFINARHGGPGPVSVFLFCFVFVFPFKFFHTQKWEDKRIKERISEKLGKTKHMGVGISQDLAKQGTWS